MFTRSSHRLMLIVISALFFYQCQKETSFSLGTNSPPGQVITTNPLKANLQGNILDETGQPAAGVVIKVGNDITVTDDRGYFRINNASLDKNAALVTAEKTGYFTAFRSFSASSGTNQVVIKLVKKALGGSVDAASGGDVSLSNGTKISLPANAVVKASDNSSYTGVVNVFAVYIDPTATDILDRVPGSFMANDKDGKRVVLSSYGMMAVELESAAGEKLQVKAGNTATLTSPIPSAAQAAAPATIPLWYVDEATGLWKEEGTATKQGNFYVGTVKHFSYWNCDIPVQTIMLTGKFVTAKGQPLVNAHISIKPTSGNFFGSAHGYTDSLGQINGPVPMNSDLKLEVMSQCGTAIYTQNIGPFSKNSDLGTITIPSATPSLYTVQGKLTNCAGAAVTKGYAIVSVNNRVQYAKVDAGGNFSADYILCNVTGATAQVIGVDETAQQQGTAASAAITSSVTNMGTIAACGTVSTETIDYTLDGTTYKIGATDSTLAYSKGDSIGNTVNSTIIMGSKTPDQIEFIFKTTAEAPGSYQLLSISAQNYRQNTIVQPFNVTLTSFAKTAGEFYEGSFTGQFKDGSNVTHNISCTFRVRRTF
jgi:hypothetical protein